jgi:hypothetical protein
MTSSKAAQKTINVDLNPAPKGRLKALGGSARDEWNGRLSILIAQAMPVDRNNVAACNEAATAALSGLADINPADPIEAMLIAQMVVANEAALALYRRAWLNMPDYFEAGTQFMALADKASRTVALLAERIGQHRGRGQQQITVKHVTVNADQAVVADKVLTAGGGVGGKDDGRPHAVERMPGGGHGEQRWRYKGEHVTVNADQAVVADKVLTAGGGVGGKDDGRPHAQAALAHASGTPMPCAMQEDRRAVSIARDAERQV